MINRIIELVIGAILLGIGFTVMVVEFLEIAKGHPEKILSAVVISRADALGITGVEATILAALLWFMPLILILSGIYGIWLRKPVRSKPISTFPTPPTPTSDYRPPRRELPASRQKDLIQ